VARVLSTAFLVALLVATAGAFALTEGAKLEKTPIYQTEIDKVFSPVCNCKSAVANIRFRLRKREHLTVWMERDGGRVETIVPGKTFRAGPVHLVFDGITQSGIPLPDGDYRPVVRLPHRTFRIPSTITIDTKPPVVRVRHRIYTHISPGVPGHSVFSVPYRVSKPAHGILYVDGEQVEFTYKEPLHGTLRWTGRIRGRLAPAGNYVLEISAQDLAGNRAKPFPFAVVAIRYIELGRSRILARPGARFSVLVLTDAPKVTWLFNRARGESGHGTLTLRAPRKPGVYRLYVEAGGHAAKALVVVA
jgi:hypothetical protein